jgi:AhpD family alkylhydroperoxidase
MSEDVKEFYKDFKRSMGQMQQEAGETVSGFMGLFKNVMGEGELSVAEKEAVALGIAVAVQCKECIRLHVKKSLDAGLTRKQIMEAAGVAVMMSGGPAYTHLPDVLKALDACEED